MNTLNTTLNTATHTPIDLGDLRDEHIASAKKLSDAAKVMQEFMKVDYYGESVATFASNIRDALIKIHQDVCVRQVQIENELLHADEEVGRV